MASGEPANLSPLPITQSSSRISRDNVDDLSDVANDQDQRFARDIEWKVVGPMPVDLFLKTFLPHRIPRIDGVTFSKVPDKPGKESAIYSPLVNRVVPSSYLPLTSRPEG